MIQKEMDTVVLDVIQRTYNVKSIRVGYDEKVAFRPGQFLSVSLGEGKELTRWLSISNSPTEKGYLEFTKKLTESGFSKKLDGVKKGDALKIKYPFGNFIFEGGYKKVAFLSGGIGITPIRSMAKYVCDKKLDTDMVLLYGNHSEKDIAFRDDFLMMSEENPAFEVVNVLCVPDKAGAFRVGYITADVIKGEVPDHNERKFFLCGPPKMVSGMQEILKGLSVPKENVIIENFAGY